MVRVYGEYRRVRKKDRWSRTRTVVGAILAFITGAFMTADGLHALITGAYFGGSLGPWATVVRAVGIGPHSVVMKVLFVYFGAMWLCSVWLWVRRIAPRFRFVLAICTLWYAPVGTVISVIELVLVMNETSRRGTRTAV
jgi:hypothetical protein